MYYLGIDGGGHYSRLIGVDENKKVIGRHAGNGLRLKASHPQEAQEAFSANLRKLVSEFNKLTNTLIQDCAGVCIGMSGYTPDQDEVLKANAEQIGLPSPIFVTDQELLLATEAKGKPGILIFSGTDSFGYSRDDKGAVWHAGGWGHLIDGGSGFWIGMQAIQSAFKASEGMISASQLTDKIMVHFGVKSMKEVREVLYAQNFNKTKIAELAFIVKYAAETDSHARAIENQAAEELFLSAKALMEKSVLAVPLVVLAGNTLLTSTGIQTKLTALLKKAYPKASVSIQKEKPEMGAVSLVQRLGIVPK